MPQAPTQSSLTVLLNRWQRGDVDALAKVLGALMHDLEKMARSRMRGEDQATIAPDDLLHEALLRAMNARDRKLPDELGDATGDAASGAASNAIEAVPDVAAWESRAHFMAHMSLHMRAVLIDRARARRAEKRGGAADHVTLSAVDAEGIGDEAVVADLIALDEALTALEAIDARGARVLHLAAFGGLTREEIADVVQVSVPTVDRELRFARAWLANALGHHAST
jgi:RNA polymerase sigma factor (sigma-70 family)